MTRITSIFFIGLAIYGCSPSFESKELNSNFTKSELSDLQKLTDFFQSQMCVDAANFKSCADSIVPQLIEHGYLPILENIDYQSQVQLYQTFESGLFSEIWSFCENRNFRSGITHHSVCLNADGKYVKFLADLSLRNSDLKEYYDLLISSGDWESMGLLETKLITNPKSYDLNDPCMQVLVSVHFLTQNDQQKRKDG
jgi:hypothetical protein